MTTPPSFEIFDRSTLEATMKGARTLTTPVCVLLGLWLGLGSPYGVALVAIRLFAPSPSVLGGLDIVCLAALLAVCLLLVGVALYFGYVRLTSKRATAFPTHVGERRG